jgi:hypothetical protein
MEINLGSETVIGERGWLWEESDALWRIFGVTVSCAADIPFLNALICGIREDNHKLSKAEVWLPDPTPSELQRLLQKFFPDDPKATKTMLMHFENRSVGYNGIQSL